MSPLFVRRSEEFRQNLVGFIEISMGIPYKLYRNTNARIHLRRDSKPNISNKKFIVELIVLQCVLYKSIHFLIQLEQCLMPKSPCKEGNQHHQWSRRQESTVHVRRDSNPNILNIIHPLELIVLCCILYKPIQFRASGYIWGWLFDISDSPYKFRLNSSGCVLHSPAELKFIRGGR